MLIEFSLSNYRSFRERQTFSMVAAPRLHEKGNVFKPKVEGEKLPSLLKVAAVYGPNASGKSNLIKAFGIVHALIGLSPSDSLPVAPFRFDPELATEPSRFEFHFIAKGLRYEFRLAATPDRVVEERLISYPKGKEVLLFSRAYAQGGERYEFGDSLEGGPLLHAAWQNLTNPKQLFLAQAAINSSEELTQLKTPLHFLNQGIRVVSRNLERLSNIALALAKEQPSLNFEDYLANLLNELDVPISKVKIEDTGDRKSLMSLLKESEGTESQVDVEKIHETIKGTKTTLTHKTALGEAQFDLSDESDGTKNLIGFAFFWRLMNDSEFLTTVAVDELDSSLHPRIVARLVEKILSYQMPSQLIFSTHDTHLMDTKLLRRDQLWITERNINGATVLRSIHDFAGRDSEDIEKRYYEGRYRGLPSLL